MNTDSFVKYWRENGGGTYGKVSYNCFYDRVKHGRDWKEAMQKQNRKYQTNVYKPQPQKQTEKRTDYTGVDITYSQEEAKVFKNMFENIINDLEKKYEKAEEPHEANKIFEKIEFVKRDYQIFLHHNS